MSTNEEYIDSVLDEESYFQYMPNELRKSYHQKFIAALPLEIKKRVRALRKLQSNTIDLDVKYHRDVYELERKYEQLNAEYFQKRSSIVNGDYEPNVDECNYADPPYAQLIKDTNPNNVLNNIENYGTKGIPNFWLTILKNVPLLDSIVKDVDEPALKHLTDVRVITEEIDNASFKLEFHFSNNSYFSDNILTKEYFLKCSPDDDDPLLFDGPEINFCRGCNINWYPDKNLTIRHVKKKGPDRNEMNTVKADTFFDFFNPPTFSDDDTSSINEDIKTKLETDFEMGHYLKDRIIPRAILYFTGECDDFTDSSLNDDSDGCDVSEEEEGVGNGDGDS